MIIYYVRHGDPNYEHNCLTPKGKIEAAKCAEFFKDKKIDAIFSSDSGRAMETASYTKNILNIRELKLLSFANEENTAKYFWAKVGNLNTWCFYVPSYIEVFEQVIYDEKWYEHPFFKSKPYLEGYNFFGNGVKEWLHSLNVKYDENKKRYISIGKNPDAVILFAHGGAAYPILSNLLKINFPLFINRFAGLDTCGITKIELDLNKPMSVKLMNFDIVPY